MQVAAAVVVARPVRVVIAAAVVSGSIVGLVARAIGVVVACRVVGVGFVSEAVQVIVAVLDARFITLHVLIRWQGGVIDAQVPSAML